MNLCFLQKLTQIWLITHQKLDELRIVVVSVVVQDSSCSASGLLWTNINAN